VQKRAIEEFARSRGIEVIEYFVDKGESGAKPFKQRPAAREMLEKLERGEAKCVIAWALDRLGRSMLDTLNTVIGLESKEIKVITIKEEWMQTLDENIRKLILSILAWAAEHERRRIRERQEEAWKQGKQKGRPPKITAEEIEKYLKRYPTLSIRAITDLINADRRRKGLPEVSYYTVYKKIKELGYAKRLTK